MKVISVYEQYFEAECEYAGEKQRAVVASLVATSDAGQIMYDVKLNFFPYRDETDFVIPFEPCVIKQIYNAKGRRSKKKEEKFLAEFQTHADELATGLGGRVFWDKPIRPAKRG